MYKKFLYFICEEDGRFVSVKNGVVSSTSKPTPLTNTPDGWQEITLAWERDMKLLGLVRQLSLPFGFVTESAMILRKWFYQQSLERKLFLIIAKWEPDIDLTGQLFNPLYQKFYKGEIDPTSFKSSALKVEANVTEGGLHKLLSANRGTQYEFNLSEGDAVVKLDGIALRQTAKYLITSSDTAYRELHFVDGSFLNKEGEGTGIAFFSQIGGQVPFNYNYGNGVDYLFITTIAITGLNIKGSVRMRPNHSGGFYRLYLNRTMGAQVDLVNVPITSTDFIDISFNLTINTQPGEKFYLLGFKSGGANNSIISYGETYFDISVKSTYRTTHAKAYTPFALYKKLIKQVAGKEDYALSNLLLQYSHLKLTSGDGVRGIDGAKIKTSLDTFFDFCYVIMFAGLGVEGGKIVIEDRRHFLNSTSPIQLGEAKNVEITEAADLLFNTVKVGYGAIQTDDVNGKSSFNNSFTFGTAITRVNKEFTLICPYAADPFAIELTRINLEGKTTTDDKSDNQVFILDAPNKSISKTVYSEKVTDINYINFDDADNLADFVPGTTFTVTNSGFLDGTYSIISAYILSGGTMQIQVQEDVPQGVFSALFLLSSAELYRDPLMTITGVPDPATIFNIRLSPKRILLKWMPWLNSILYREPGMKLTFLSTDKNADLVTVENGLTIAEKASVSIGTQRLFLCKEISFETMVPTSLANQLEADPSSAFSLIWEGRTYIGFTRKAGMAPSDEKEQTFKLLSAPSNDFKYLIHG